MIGRRQDERTGGVGARRSERVAMLRQARETGEPVPAGAALAIGGEAPARRDPWAEPWDDEPRAPLGRRVGRGALTLLNALVVIVVIGGLGFAGGGFLRYFDEVESFVPPPLTEVARADGIVALTGGPQRLEAAGRLLQAGRADQLLVSGVNLRATEPQLRRLLGVDDATFACCVELGFEARDTIGNARETSTWFGRLTDEATGVLGSGDASRLIVVTSNYHMRRALHEIGRALPGVALEPYPVHGLDLSDGEWWRKAGNWRLLIGEYGKLVLARARDYPAIARILGSVLAPAPAADL